MPGGFGNVSRYLNTRLCCRPLPERVSNSRASSRLSRHMKLVVTATLSFTNSPTGSALPMFFL